MTDQSPETPARSRARDRLHRQLDRLRADLPWLDRWIAHLQSHRGARLRLPLAILLILGGLFSFLPLLGLWMAPLGLVLLALDVPALQTPVASALIRIRRWWALRRR